MCISASDCMWKIACLQVVSQARPAIRLCGGKLQRGSGNTACNVFYQWNSIIADVARILTSFTTNARLLNLRNTIVVVADRARSF